MASQIIISKTTENVVSVPEKQVGHFDDNSLSLWWLGQAGFFLKYKNQSVLIDPYLSDFLAQKYKGQEFPHIRMIPSPIDVEQIRNLNFVFCTHGHSDHMDPGALTILAKNNPACRFIVPRAEKATAMERGIAENKLISVNAADSIALNSDIHLDVIPASHELLKTNSEGDHHYLGYIIRFGDLKIYHSGDCIPFDGLTEMLINLKVDVSLLPVNGREDYLSSKGILGNFSFEEAVQLCVESGIPNLIVHHFGMFEFNTVDEKILDKKISEINTEKINIIKPEIDSSIIISIDNL